MATIYRVPLSVRDPKTGKVRARHARLPYGYRDGQGGAMGASETDGEDAAAARRAARQAQRQAAHEQWTREREAELQDLRKRVGALERRVTDLEQRPAGGAGGVSLEHVEQLIGERSAKYALDVIHRHGGGMTPDEKQRLQRVETLMRELGGAMDKVARGQT